jgi:hypothetical protein
MTTNRKSTNMPQTAEELYQKLTQQLNHIALEEPQILQQTRLSIDAAKDAMNELRTLSCTHAFASTNEEIHFFKTVKPRIYSKLIYYLKVFSLETRRPNGSRKDEEQFLFKEMQKLNHFFENNISFYQYYRTGASYLDEQYFLRGAQDLYLSLDPQYFNADPNFSSPQDYRLSKLLANEQMRVYIDNALLKVNQHDAAAVHASLTPLLNWTGSKTALIELLYALQSSGVFNNGAADVKQIAICLQETFNVELGNYYRTFQEIRIRKGSRTNFLEQLKERLVQRMDETDEQIRH